MAEPVIQRFRWQVLVVGWTLGGTLCLKLKLYNNNLPNDKNLQIYVLESIKIFTEFTNGINRYLVITACADSCFVLVVRWPSWDTWPVNVKPICPNPARHQSVCIFLLLSIKNLMWCILFYFCKLKFATCLVILIRERSTHICTMASYFWLNLLSKSVQCRCIICKLD